MVNAEMTQIKSSKKSEDTRSMSDKSGHSNDSVFSEHKNKKRDKKRCSKALPIIESEERLKEMEEAAPPMVKITDL